MFNNLIESRSHVREFKRRGRFLLATTAAYGLLFFVAGIASIYAYDARLDAQNGDLALLSWVPPVPATTIKPPHEVQQPRRSFTPTAPVDPTRQIPQRINPTLPADDPRLTPPTVGITASTEPPITGPVEIGPKNLDPQASSSGDKNGCANCPDRGSQATTIVEVKPTPEPTPVKPSIERLSSIILASKAISLPQPAYPEMAKRVRIQGPVNVQILLDEKGRVVSAQVVNGNPMLTTAARDAAMRARFTPTVLNGQAVKVQGVITYNFVLQ